MVHPIVQHRSNGSGGGGVAQRLITRLGSMGGERLAWARGSRFHTEEFYVKVLKFEIMNSWKLFNYSSKAVPRTIEFVHHVTLSPGRFKNWFHDGRFKNR